MVLKSLDWTNNSFIKKELPVEFEDFLIYFEEWLLTQKNAMKKFLCLDYEANVVVWKKIKNFSFNPSKKLIYVPLNWLKNFHKNIISWIQENHENNFLYSFDDLKFGIYHELSHFRDMIFEKDSSKRKSMIDILKFISKQKIKYWSNKYIPIWENLHGLVNCIDDIIVNTEVVMNIWTKINDKHLNWFYKYNMFADLIQKKWWDYIINNELWELEYVWNGKWTHIINAFDDVDYSKWILSNSFPDFLLRSFMVKDQKILLPEYVENIFFRNEERTNTLGWKWSIKKMIENMLAYYTKLEKEADPKIEERIKNLRLEYFRSVQELEDILKNPKILENKLFECIKKVWSNKCTPGTINILDIVDFFTKSTWKESLNHSLDITPSLRYEIYKLLLLPIQKWFILMDLLTQDIKNLDENPKDWDSKDWDPKNNDSKDWEEDKKNGGTKSGKTCVHESPDLEAKIKLLENIDKEENEKKASELIKKQVEESKFAINNILQTSWVSEQGIKILNHITTKYSTWIKELIDFFIQELQKIEKKEDIHEFNAKKWTLNLNEVRNCISSDPTQSELDKQRLYNRKETIEKIDETFKKIDLTFAIDISSSIDSFKGADWMTNIISTILFVVMTHLESHIRLLIEDPLYKIPVNFVLYWDWLPYCSRNSQYKDSISTVRIAELNWGILSLSWWTNDTTWWQKIANEFDKFFQQNPDYIEEIIKGERKSVILQIADTDVSENWVESLKKTFLNYLKNSEIVNLLPIKRIILWNVDLIEITKEEFLRYKNAWTLGNWDIEYLPSGKYQLRQISIKNKNEILWQIKELFKNFFGDINIKAKN